MQDDEGSHTLYPLAASRKGYSLNIDISDISVDSSLFFQDQESGDIIGLIERSATDLSLKWIKSHLNLRIKNRLGVQNRVTIQSNDHINYLRRKMENEMVIHAPSLNFQKDIISADNISLISPQCSLKNITTSGMLTLNTQAFENNSKIKAKTMILNSIRGDNKGELIGENIYLLGKWQQHHCLQAEMLEATGEEFVTLPSSRNTIGKEFISRAQTYKNRGQIIAPNVDINARNILLNGSITSSQDKFFIPKLRAVAEESIRVGASSLPLHVYLKAPQKIIYQLPARLLTLTTEGDHLLFKGPFYTVINNFTSYEKIIYADDKALLVVNKAILDIKKSLSLSQFKVKDLTAIGEEEVYFNLLKVAKQSKIISRSKGVIVKKIDALGAVIDAEGKSVTILESKAGSIKATGTENAYVSHASADQIHITSPQGMAHGNHVHSPSITIEGASAMTSGEFSGKKVNVTATKGDILNTAHFEEGAEVHLYAQEGDVVDSGKHDEDTLVVRSKTNVGMQGKGSPKTLDMVFATIHNLYNLLAKSNGIVAKEALEIVQLGSHLLELQGKVHIKTPRVKLTSRGPLKAPNTDIRAAGSLDLDAQSANLAHSEVKVTETINIKTKEGLGGQKLTLSAQKINIESGEADLSGAKLEAIQQTIDIKGHLVATAISMIAKARREVGLEALIQVFASTIFGASTIETRGNWNHSHQVLAARPAFDSEGKLVILTHGFLELFAPFLKSADAPIIGSFSGNATLGSVTLEEIKRWREVFTTYVQRLFWREPKTRITEYMEVKSSVIGPEFYYDKSLVFLSGPEDTFTAYSPHLIGNGNAYHFGAYLKILATVPRHLKFRQETTSKKRLFTSSSSEITYTEMVEEVNPPVIQIKGGNLELQATKQSILQSVAAYIEGYINNNSPILVFDACKHGYHAQEDHHEISTFSEAGYGSSYHYESAFPSYIDIGGFRTSPNSHVLMVGTNVHDRSEEPLDPRVRREEIVESESSSSYGWVKGRNQVALSLVTTIVSLAASYFVGPYIAAQLSLKAIGTAIVTTVSSALAGQATNSGLQGRDIGKDLLTTSSFRNLAASLFTAGTTNGARLTSGAFGDILLKVIHNLSVRSFAEIVIAGRKPEDVFKNNVMYLCAEILGEYGAHELADAYKGQKIDWFLHKGGHALLGAIEGAMLGKEAGAISGAIGAAAAETLIEMFSNVSQEYVKVRESHPDATPDKLFDFWKQDHKLRDFLVRATAMSAGSLIGKDTQAAAQAVHNAIDHNFEYSGVLFEEARKKQQLEAKEDNPIPENQKDHQVCTKEENDNPKEEENFMDVLASSLYETNTEPTLQDRMLSALETEQKKLAQTEGASIWEKMAINKAISELHESRGYEKALGFSINVIGKYLQRELTAIVEDYNKDDSRPTFHDQGLTIFQAEQVRLENLKNTSLFGSIDIFLRRITVQEILDDLHEQRAMALHGLEIIDSVATPVALALSAAKFLRIGKGFLSWFRISGFSGLIGYGSQLTVSAIGRSIIHHSTAGISEVLETHLGESSTEVFKKGVRTLGKRALKIQSLQKAGTIEVSQRVRSSQKKAAKKAKEVLMATKLNISIPSQSAHLKPEYIRGGNHQITRQ
jgi:hypothetical protein